MGIEGMKVYEVGMPCDSDDDNGDVVVWIRTDREITLVEGGDALYCKEIDIAIDDPGIDLNIE